MASPWLQEGQEIRVGFSGFVSNFHFSLYKFSGVYGLSDSFNVGVDSTYNLEKKGFDNNVWLKVKILEKDQNDLQYIAAAQLSSGHFIYDSVFHFNNAVVKGLVGVKLDGLFSTFEISNAFTLKKYDPTFYVSVGYDYSEHTSFSFTKQIFSPDTGWSFGLVKNILATIDILCNYHYHTIGGSKLEVGARVRFRP